MGSYSFYQTPLRSDELYHHGIKGQKWGVRRFQQANGTLTSTGKKRYLTAVGGAVKKVAGAAQKSIDKSKTPLQRVQSANQKMSTINKAKTPIQRKQQEDAEKRTSGGIKEKWDNLSPKTKTAIKVGGAAVAAGLAVYGGYKLKQHGEIKDIAQQMADRHILKTASENASYQAKVDLITESRKAKSIAESNSIESKLWDEHFDKLVKERMTASNRKKVAGEMYGEAKKRYLDQKRTAAKSAKSAKAMAKEARRQAQQAYLNRNLPNNTTNVKSTVRPYGYSLNRSPERYRFHNPQKALEYYKPRLKDRREQRYRKGGTNYGAWDWGHRR